MKTDILSILGKIIELKNNITERLLNINFQRLEIDLRNVNKKLTELYDYTISNISTLTENDIEIICSKIIEVSNNYATLVNNADKELTLALASTDQKYIGLWYQTTANINTKNTFCLNSGTIYDPNTDTVTTTDFIQSKEITWSSQPGTICPIAPYQEGQSPLNTIYFFPSTNNVDEAIKNVTDNKSTEGKTYNCIKDAVDYFNINSKYYNNADYGDVPDSKIIVLTLGAGNSGPTGYWTKSVIAEIINKLKNGILSPSNTYYYDEKSGFSYGFNGICYDIETGEGGLIDALTGGENSWSYNGITYDGLFYATEKAGFLNFITISHTAPYGFPTDETFSITEAIYKSPHVNQYIIQLYSQSVGTMNEYAITNGVTFDNIAVWIQQNPNWNANKNILISPTVYITKGFTYDKKYYNSLIYSGGTNTNYEPLMSYNDSENKCNCSNTDTVNPGFGFPYPYPPPSNQFNNRTDEGAQSFINKTFQTNMNSYCQWSNGNFIEKLY